MWKVIGSKEKGEAKMVSCKKISAILNRCKVNPKSLSDDRLRIILSVGSSDYYKTRAIEAIHNNRLELAITLLAVAIAYKEKNEKV